MSNTFIYSTAISCSLLQKLPCRVQREGCLAGSGTPRAHDILHVHHATLCSVMYAPSTRQHHYISRAVSVAHTAVDCRHQLLTVSYAHCLVMPGNTETTKVEKCIPNWSAHIFQIYFFQFRLSN